jgi:transcriptional regulator with XRE-family HTH domain
LPFCHVTLAAKKPKSEAYPKALISTGDHIRKRRLDLGMLQKDVAVAIGVDTCTITNWEKNRCRPQLHLIPRVVRFLGYDPLLMVETGELGEMIRQYRRSRAIAQKKLAQELGIDPTTLARWEKGMIKTKGERTKEVPAQLLSMLSEKEQPAERTSPASAPGW